jgi:hypothetical protein
VWLLFASAAGAVVPGAVAAEPGTRRALLIGINQYQAFPLLRGARNDIELIEQILRSRFGFRSEDIERVTDAAATRAGILAALDRLVSGAAPEDVVYIHYSGHGSQQTDRNGDEAGDQLDETLVPHDGRTPGVADILDDELAERLSRVRARRTVVVLDSCHSGTATRSIAVQTRSVPPDPRADLYAEKAVTRAILPMAEERYLLLSATPPDQSALDGPVDGKPYGLFSYSLARTLGTARSSASVREIVSNAQSELGRIKVQLGLVQIPEPQLEGPESWISSPIFATSSPSRTRLPWVAAEPRPGSSAVVLRAGASLGAVPGSLWAIYPPGEERFAPGNALGEAVVDEVRGSDAIGRLEPPKLALPNGARAVLLAAPQSRGGIAVRWRGERTGRPGAAIDLLRARLPALELVGERDFARFVVEPGGDTWRVYAADGVSLIRSLEALGPEAVADELARLLKREVAAADLMALDNPASAMRLDLAVVRSGERGLTIVAADAGAATFRIRPPGEPRTSQNSLQLRVETSDDCYLTIAHLDAEGVLQVLFPNAISEQRDFLPRGRIAAGTSVLIPDSLGDANRAGFHFDYAAPAGIDTVRAFCSASIATASQMRSELASVGSRGASGLGALRPRFARVASRGIALVPAEEPSASASASPDAVSSDWTAATVTIEVVDSSGESSP